MGISQSGTHATPRLDLGRAFMEHQMQAGTLIGTRVFPIFKTQKKAATYAAITRASILRQDDTKRAARGNYNRGDWETVDKTFACVENGLEGLLDDTERELYASDFDAEMITSQITGDRVLRAQEIRIAALIFNTSTFAGADLYTDVSASPWDSAADCMPVDNVIAGKEKVRQNCGLEPNTLVMGQGTYNNLLRANDIKSRIVNVAKLTQAEILASLAPIFGLEKLLVGKAVYNTANEGQAFSGTDVWSDDYVNICVTPSDGANLAGPAVGRTFLWAVDSPENTVVEQYRSESNRSDVFRVRQYTDEELIDAYFGHLLKVDA